ncbi:MULTISPECIES: MarR family transcriptional regulator [Planococcus]|uniref:MarR family transcriptional regulator n=1 Tax=Planococcus faecalis TaxID=1598147 RepID=A0ABN4XIC5_9BACL|nr:MULTISPECIES: MarR family transcriptional regulator [Planococcus]AQU79488.1 MarR family transcriptional regulator [Planococcus faecalis]MDJ0332567.1 MarR family transcriptional regulator [Planococcus sp. S3-L1]OHX51452.1 MarR family transcriptional regulator [Planococcus faecalis]
METENLFKLIHTVEAITNRAIVDWNDIFPHNIGVSPILVLSELERNGPQNQMKLADLLGFTGGAMTNIASKLVKLELAIRTFNDSDRRQVLLKVTPKGSLLLQEAQRLGKRQHIEMFQVLDEEEIAQYLSINEKLLKSLKTKKSNR